MKIKVKNSLEINLEVQGVPKVRLDFVFTILAPTEKLLTFIQQPWKFLAAL